MSKHKALTGAIAALASVATLGALAAPALAADTTYSPNGKSVAELAQHGGAQRIAAIGNKKAKNVVLFIGDGMGDSEITVARDYLKGANGHFDGLDAVGQPSALGDVQAGTGQYTTFSVGNGSKDSAVGKDDDGKLVANPNPGKLTPVTDSSASGSSWGTGTKTYNNAVDVDIYGNPQLNLFELAKAAGKATGNVTTAEIQDATPAVLESHSSERACYGPQGKTDGTSNNASKQCLINQLKENGGIGSISGSCIASFLYIACSEWWLRFLDNEAYIGAFKVPLLRNGFRMVVFSIIIMIVVLFFRKGIMGDKELPDLLRRHTKKGGGEK